MTDAPNLSASHLIHVNSPTWNAGTQDQCIGDLDKATMNILALADKEGLTSVALPSISSGKYVKQEKIKYETLNLSFILDRCSVCLVLDFQNKRLLKPF